VVNHFERLFPRLRGSGFRVSSPCDDVYNCIAWALSVTDAWWWPVGVPPRNFWPEGVPREVTLEAFRLVFAKVGYEVCASDGLESGFEKVALFVDELGPSHAARQLSDGRWTSKLGQLQDIEHDLHDLEGDHSGTVSLIMRRPLAPPPSEGTIRPSEGQ
jgi:hypothetical protein